VTSDEKRPAGDELTHLDASGAARMVDVGGKPATRRRASAEAFVAMRAETLELVTAGDIPKGDVLAAARIAGIMAAKRTSELIPLCHPIGLTHATIELDTDAEGVRPGIRIAATCETVGSTGVEMEALTAASVAALTVYDMCKAVERGITFEVGLVGKDGGASGPWSVEDGDE
jgi:cyclic pyranopterin phosphate synthase